MRKATNMVTESRNMLIYRWWAIETTGEDYDMCFLSDIWYGWTSHLVQKTNEEPLHTTFMLLASWKLNKTPTNANIRIGKSSDRLYRDCLSNFWDWKTINFCKWSSVSSWPEVLRTICNPWTYWFRPTVNQYRNVKVVKWTNFRCWFCGQTWSNKDQVMSWTFPEPYPMIFFQLRFQIISK